LKAARQDLLVIERILDDAGLPFMVLFHAQQCVEKSFKALHESRAIPLPKIHDLVRLHAMLNEPRLAEIDVRMLELLDSAYTEARYPGELGLLPHGEPTMEEAADAYRFARQVRDRVAVLAETPGPV
jgi:HEPN domain-containing protein